MGIDPATMMMASAVVSSVGTYSNIQNVKAANQRERVRYERERKIAKLQAIEEENMRKDMLNQTLANNLAVQSAAGYYDDSRSFLNINAQARKKAEKDIKNIRLMGKVVDLKMRDQMFENDIKAKSEIFGGWISIGDQLSSGYAMYDYYKGSGTQPKSKD